MNFKKIIQENFSKDSIKTILITLLTLLGLFYGMYLLSVHKFLLLGLVILSPLVGYLWLDDEKNENNKKGIGGFIMIVGIILAICVGCQSDKYEVMIAKKVMNGSVQKFMIDIEDEDGRPGTKEKQVFIPYKETDNYKLEIISWLFWGL